MLHTSKWSNGSSGPVVSIHTMSQGHLELFRRVTVVKRYLGHRNWYWSRSVLSSLSMGVCINLPSWKCRGRLQLVCSFLQQFATIRGSFFWAFVTRVALFLAAADPLWIRVVWMWRFTRKKGRAPLFECCRWVRDLGADCCERNDCVKGGMAHWGISSCASEKMPDGSQIC